jgi:hypothetical protein
MTTINRRLSKVGLLLCTALLLSGAAGSAARASPIPTSSDEARALPMKVLTRAAAATAPVRTVISSTDEARALAGSSLPISITNAATSRTVTSTDEARALAGEEVPVEIERAVESAVASRAERH